MSDIHKIADTEQLTKVIDYITENKIVTLKQLETLIGKERYLDALNWLVNYKFIKKVYEGAKTYYSLY